MTNRGKRFMRIYQLPSNYIIRDVPDGPVYLYEGDSLILTDEYTGLTIEVYVKRTADLDAS